MDQIPFQARKAIPDFPSNTTARSTKLAFPNNLAENAIRTFVIGRKNFLFSGSHGGAHASATLYSLIETAKANGLEPLAYLSCLFERMPEATTPAAINALLPQNLTLDDLKLEAPKL